MIRQLCLLLGAAALTASAGCIANHKYGCDFTTLVAPGSAEGRVFHDHGCPDQVIELGNPVDANTHHWNRYLVVYRIGEGHMLLGNIKQDDRFQNLCYLIENGHVVQGGFAEEGSGGSILMPLADAMHPKARVGYGGDWGFPGEYGIEGRLGVHTGDGGASLTVNVNH